MLNEFFEKMGESIRRETVYKYYLDIGTYAWIVSGCAGLIDHLKQSMNRQQYDADIRAAIDWRVVHTHEILTGRLDPSRSTLASFRPWSTLRKEFVWTILREDFNAANGYSLKVAHGYLARAQLISNCLHADKEGGSEKLKRAAMEVKAFLSESLTRYPLRRRLPVEVFPWAEGWHTGTKWVA